MIAAQKSPEVQTSDPVSSEEFRKSLSDLFRNAPAALQQDFVRRGPLWQECKRYVRGVEQELIPDFVLWCTIRHEPGRRTIGDIIDLCEQRRVHIAQKVKQLTQLTRALSMRPGKECRLTLRSGADLGFPSEATYLRIREKGERHGLKPCSEVAAFLVALQHAEEIELGVSVVFVMPEFAIDGEKEGKELVVLRLGRDTEGVWVDWERVSNMTCAFSPETLFVFEM